VYLEKAFDGHPSDRPSDGRTWRPAKRLPVAKELGETSLMFLVHPTLTEAEIGKTCQVLAEVMAGAMVSLASHS
jgi:dTDP-4-amino-4,6-dideoxygalactose transaminase